MFIFEDLKKFKETRWFSPFHTKHIARGNYGELSKIKEELEEA